MSTGVTVFVVVLLVCIVLAAALPTARHVGGVEEMGHHQMDRQFQRPQNESELL